jgi:hypothetical protein
MSRGRWSKIAYHLDAPHIVHIIVICCALNCYDTQCLTSQNTLLVFIRRVIYPPPSSFILI